MNSRKAFGPGVEEFREKYKSPLTYEHFRSSLNKYLRTHRAAELDDGRLICQLFELTINCHRDLAAAEEMTIVFRSRDWKARSKVAKKARTEVEKLTAWLKRQCGRDGPLTTNFVRLLLNKIQAAEAVLEDLDVRERADHTMVRGLLHSKSWKLRGSGPETGHIFALDRCLARALPNEAQAYRNLVIAASLLAGRLVPQSGYKAQEGQDVLDTIRMRRSRAKTAYAREGVEVPGDDLLRQR